MRYNCSEKEEKGNNLGKQLILVTTQSEDYTALELFHSLLQFNLLVSYEGAGDLIPKWLLHGANRVNFSVLIS